MFHPKPIGPTASLTFPFQRFLPVELNSIFKNVLFLLFLQLCEFVCTVWGFVPPSAGVRGGQRFGILLELRAAWCG